jgi:uncharacterized protein
VLALTACLLALTTAAAPAAPTRWVTDEAQLLSPAAKARLDARLQTYERQTGHQVLVYIAKTTGGIPIEDWANEAFQEWAVGRTRIDDGAVLFIFTDDRAARIEVGYGLEERLTDAAASRIIREVLAPGMAAGRAEPAIAQTVGLLLATIGGETGQGGTAPQPVARRPPTPLEIGLMILGGLGLLYLFWRHPALALYILSVLLRRGGGGGAGGNGGFGGGGGRSGGGGASGRW